MSRRALLHQATMVAKTAAKIAATPCAVFDPVDHAGGPSIEKNVVFASSRSRLPPDPCHTSTSK